jgi:hypothetical protein
MEISTRSEKSDFKVTTRLIARSNGYLFTLKSQSLTKGGSVSELEEYATMDELESSIGDMLEKTLFSGDEEAEEPHVHSQVMSGNYKKKPDRFWFWGMGPANPHGLKRQSYSQWTFGYAWMYDNQILRLEMESASPSNDEESYLSGFGFTGMHLLNEGRLSWFLSATLQTASLDYMSMNMDGASEQREIDGYIGGAGFGALFWTSSTMLIEVSTYSRTLMTKVDGKMPGVTGLKVGLYW